MPDTFSYVPDRQSSVQTEVGVVEVMLGGSFGQRKAEGINNVRRVFRLFFKENGTNLEAIDTFFKEKKGTIYFFWTPTDYPSSLGKFVCSQWGYSYDSPLAYGISATFKEVFDA